MFPSRRITIGGGDKFRDDYSLSFDGSDDHLELKTALELEIDTVAHSFAFWCTRNTVDSWDTVLGYSATSGENHLIFNNDGTTILIEGNDSGDKIAFTLSHTMVVNRWYHFVMTFDGSGNASCYQDGVKLSDDGETIASNFNINHIGLPNVFNGKISDLAIYDAELTQAQAIGLYNDREPYNHREGAVAKNLLHWWRMGDTTGRKAYYTAEEQIITTNNRTMGGSNDWTSHPTSGGATINLNDTVANKMHVTTNGDDTDEGMALAVGFIDGESNANPIVAGRTYRVKATIDRISGRTDAKYAISLGGAVALIEADDGFPSDGTITNTEQVYFADVTTVNDTGSLAIYAREDENDETLVFTVDAVHVNELGVINDDSTNSNFARMINMTADDFVGDVP